MTAKSEDLLRAGVISLVGSGVAAAAAMLLTVVVGRSLSVDGTGLFFQAIGLFTVAAQVLRFGTGTGIVRSIATQQARGEVGRGTRTLVMAVVPTTVAAIAASVAVWLLADPLADLLGSSGEESSLASSIRLLAPFLWVSVVLVVLQSMLRMVRGVGSFTLLQNILLPVSRLLAVALLAVHGLESALTGWAVPLPFWLVVTAVLLWRPLALDLSARAKIHEKDRPPAETWWEFWRFSLARGVAATLEILLDWADVLIVAALTTPAQAGIYAVVTRVVRAGQIVDRSVRVAVSPRIASLLSVGEAGRTSDLHSGVARLMVLAAWPFYLTLVVMSEAVLGIFGADFVVGSPVLVTLALSMMLAVAAGMLQSITLQAGRASWQMSNKTVALALSVCLNLVLVPRWGLAGAATTWVVVVLVDTALAAYQVHFRLGVHLHPRRLLGAMVAALSVFGLFGLAVRSVLGTSVTALVSYLVLCGGVYAAVLWRYRVALGTEPVWRRMAALVRRVTAGSSIRRR